MREKIAPTYVLRLFDDKDKEVGTSTVVITAQGQVYPVAGQTIGDIWEVVTVISHTPQERRLRVKRISGDVSR